MPTTIDFHEATTTRIIKAIERGQNPPWRRAGSTLENDGFPTHPVSLKPFGGIDVLLLNMAANERGFCSKFWATTDEWASLDCQVSGQATILADESFAYNGDQLVVNHASVAYRSRQRRTSLPVDYGPAEAVIKASGATIHHRLGTEAAYYFQEDHIVFPLKEQFVQGPGGIEAYYAALFHELSHFTEPRLGWDGPNDVRELRAEIAAPFITAQLGIPVLCDKKKLTNHRNHLDRWVKAMKADPTLIFTVAADASEAVAFLLSLREKQQACPRD